ncbi:MAG: hypothetical protein VW455_06415 [Nitrospinota bacterium]
MNNRTWVENMIWSVVLLNIAFLAYGFILPRVKIISGNWGAKPSMLMEVSGARDVPNQYIKSYKVVNLVREVTKQDSVVLMPKKEWGFELDRSVLIQRLYPRKIYFFGKQFFSESFLKTIKADGGIFVVFNKNWNARFCEGKEILPLKIPRSGICRIDK